MFILISIMGCWVTDSELEQWNKAQAEALSTPEEVESELGEKQFQSFEFVAGCYRMGITPHNYPEECGTAHEVEITYDFVMTAREITQYQFRSAMSHAIPDLADDIPDDCDNCPITNISWHQAALFANAISDAAGYETCYSCGIEEECSPVSSFLSCNGWRLPTEAEWESAARANEPHRFSGHDDIELVAWHAGNSAKQPHPIAQKKPNAFGLYDMTGNVWEWCFD